MQPRPLVGVTACLRHEEHYAVHRVVDKYVDAVVVGCDAVPVIVPALGTRLDVDSLLAGLDGLLVTGSPSNIEPWRWGGEPFDGDLNDPARDETVLRLIPRAIALGIPLFAICRGIQELNVALGGTLHPKVHELAGRRDHRSDKTRPWPERYAPAHPVRILPGGVLERLFGAGEITVNSLHGQAIDRLAPGLRVEAVADDGTIEAVSVEDAPAFALGVQWHPEWRIPEYPVHRRLFSAFAEAVRRRAQTRLRHDPEIATPAVRELGA